MRSKIKWFRPKKNMAVTVPLVIIAMSLLFGPGASLGQITLESKTTTNNKVNAGFQPSVQCRVAETHTIQYVERLLTKVEYVERIKEVSIDLRNFSSLEELKQWVVGDNNTSIVCFQRPDDTIHCSDFALRLQQKGLADGYLISFQIIEPAQYNSLFKISKLPTNTLHAINLAIIGNNAYYIEPQTGEVVLAAYLH